MRLKRKMAKKAQEDLLKAATSLESAALNCGWAMQNLAFAPQRIDTLVLQFHDPKRAWTKSLNSGPGGKGLAHGFPAAACAFVGGRGYFFDW